jgi:conjugative transfer region protein (TIGR03748 family)
VGDAVNFLLKYSGYSLVSEPDINHALKITLEKPLPIVDKEIGPVTLKTGVKTLIGPAFYLTQDPVNRVIDFKLKPNYLKFIHSKQSIRG